MFIVSLYKEHEWSDDHRFRVKIKVHELKAYTNLNYSLLLLGKKKVNNYSMLCGSKHVDRHGNW